jgi:hypothetical protein
MKLIHALYAAIHALMALAFADGLDRAGRDRGARRAGAR